MLKPCSGCQAVLPRPHLRTLTLIPLIARSLGFLDNSHPRPSIGMRLELPHQKLHSLPAASLDWWNGTTLPFPSPKALDPSFVATQLLFLPHSSSLTPPRYHFQNILQSISPINPHLRVCLLQAQP